MYMLTVCTCTPSLPKINTESEVLKYICIYTLRTLLRKKKYDSQHIGGRMS